MPPSPRWWIASAPHTTHSPRRWDGRVRRRRGWWWWWSGQRMASCPLDTLLPRHREGCVPWGGRGLACPRRGRGVARAHALVEGSSAARKKKKKTVVVGSARPHSHYFHRTVETYRYCPAARDAAACSRNEKTSYDAPEKTKTRHEGWGRRGEQRCANTYRRRSNVFPVGCPRISLPRSLGCGDAWESFPWALLRWRLPLFSSPLWTLPSLPTFVVRPLRFPFGDAPILAFLFGMPCCDYSGFLLVFRFRFRFLRRGGMSPIDPPHRLLVRGMPFGWEALVSCRGGGVVGATPRWAGERPLPKKNPTSASDRTRTDPSTTMTRRSSWQDHHHHHQDARRRNAWASSFFVHRWACHASSSSSLFRSRWHSWSDVQACR